MEENQREDINVQVEEKSEVQQENTNPEVGFPLSSQKTKKKNGSLIFIILGIVILVGGIIFFVTKGKEQSESMVSPTPTFQSIETFTPSPTETSEPVDKEEVTVEILNGTGISGEAGYLQGVLKTLGYSNIEVGNADEQDQEITTVTFSDTLDEANKSEIKTKLESLYEDVTVKTSNSADFDVSIVTGLRKGQTPKPSASATPEASKSPSPTPTATD